MRLGAVWMWARRDVSRRWRSLVVLALLAALAGGVAMAAATGARHSRVVIDEVMRERRQPDAMSIPNQPSDWGPVVRLPYVEDYGLFASTGLCLRETGGLERHGGLCTQPPVAGGWRRSISRLDAVEGRLPSRPDELAVNRPAQRRYGLRVGQRVHLEGIARDRPPATPESRGPLYDYWNNVPRGSRPWGPTFAVTVVGVYAGEDANRLLRGGVEEPFFVMAPAFMRAHGHRLAYRADAIFRLRGGAADVGRLRRDIARLLGPAAPTTDIHAARRRVERSTLMESAALWAVAAAIVVAALVLVGQALARLVRAGAADAPTLRALGMSRAQAALALSAPGLFVAALGGVGAALVAVAASPAFPIGLARSFDRHPGIRVDAPVLAVGTVGAILAAGLVAGGAGWLAARSRDPVTPARGRPLPGLRLPVAAGVGVGWAMGALGAVSMVAVAVVAAVASFTVRAGIDDALSEPARAGKVWDYVVFGSGEFTEADLAGDRDIAAASRVRSHIVAFGRRTTRAYAAAPAGLYPQLRPVVLAGRLPRGPDEVAMAPATVADLGLRIGDEVAGGPGARLRYRLVGRALVPNVKGHESYDEGAWLTVAGLDRIRPGPMDMNDFLVELREGSDHGAFRARIAAAGGDIDEVGFLEDPAGVLNLRNVRGLPALLVAFFALLGTGAVGHVLITTLRRRRRDLAVLRALGMSAGQARVVVASQATTLALAGALAGVPLGVLVGHLVWRWVATSMPLAYVAPLALPALVLAVPAAVALANAVAAGPGEAAARARPASALRAE